MLTSATKRYILPFSNQKSRDSETEAAAVFAVAELSRSKGGGLLNRQPPETIAFIAKIGYPFWLFPRNNQALVFDAINDDAYNVPYPETPSANGFLESLEKNQRPRESYTAFLSDNGNYFHQPPRERQFQLKGLIATSDFKNEFVGYRREATELTAPATLLLPLLEESAVSTMLTDLDKLYMMLKDEQEKLSEIIRMIKKITSQYITELDYEAAAATEEANAKIKAQEEFINPQVAQLNKEYNRKIKDLTSSFDQELARYQKLKAKTEKLIDECRADISQFELEAKKHAKKGHKVYENRWQDKAKQAEKELSSLKKDLKRIEDNTKKLSKQKTVDISKLNFEWDAEVKLLRQPLVDIEAARDAKLFAFKQEGNRLQALEKPIVEGIEKTIKHRETVNACFDGLGIADSQLRSPILVYVLFYVVCYEEGLARRYLCLPPSTVSSVGFSAKLKGALGISKSKDLLTPRFKTIEKLIGNLELFVRQNSFFESQLWSLGDKSNLLRNNVFRSDVEKGLVYLKAEGWLSDKEHQELSKLIHNAV
jgi:hypothetical protein